MTDSWLFGPGPIIAIQQFFGPGWELAARIVSLLGDTWGVLLVFAGGFWLWGRRTAYALAAIVVLEAASNLALNQVVHLSRPDAPGVVKYVQVPMASFPSGHVYTISALLGLLFALGHLKLGITAAVIGLVAWARLYLGTHYVGDVIGGVGFGAVLVWLFVRVWPRVGRWLRERSPGWITGGALAAATAGLAATPWLGSNVRTWEAVGLVVGASLGLLLEARLVCFFPPARPPRLVLGGGLSGLLALTAASRAVGDQALWGRAALAAVATLWAALVVPTLLQRLRPASSRSAGESRP